MRNAILILTLLAAVTLPDTVRVLEHGTRYHKIPCGALAHGAGVLVRRAAADSAGYLPCKRCLAPKAAAKATRFARVAGGK